MQSPLSLCTWQLCSRRPVILLALTASVTLFIISAISTQPYPFLTVTDSLWSSATYKSASSVIYNLTADYNETTRASDCDCHARINAKAGDISSEVRSNCGPMADRRGPHQNVIAYSYYGTNVNAYLRGVPLNAELALKFYPGWTVRVYYDGAANFSAWDETACIVKCRFDHVDLCDIRQLTRLGQLDKKSPTIWRFAVLADETVDRFLVRDLDSLLGQRERDAVDEWLASNKTFHTMRDHPWHSTVILAGMWGGWNRYNDIYRPIRQKMINATKTTAKGRDQSVLRSVLWPELVRRKDVLSHDSYLCRSYPFTRPFPTQRRDLTDFVGSQSTRRTWEVPKKCPAACRPAKHQDWEWC